MIQCKTALNGSFLCLFCNFTRDSSSRSVNAVTRRGNWILLRSGSILPFGWFATEEFLINLESLQYFLFDVRSQCTLYFRNSFTVQEEIEHDYRLSITATLLKQRLI